MADILAKASLITNFKFQLVFKRKTYINPRMLPEDPVERQLLFMQACEELASDTMFCNDTDAVKLASLRVQHDLGDYTAPTMYTAKVLEAALPKALLRKRGAEALRQLVAMEHELLKGPRAPSLPPASPLTPFRAQAPPRTTPASSTCSSPRSCCSTAPPSSPSRTPTTRHALPRPHPLTSHRACAQVRGDDQRGGAALCEDGGRQEEGDADVLVHGRQRPVSIDSVSVITENQGTTEYKTKRGPEIYNLFSDYYFWLQAQSEWCRAKEDYAVDDPSVLAFKKGDVIHIIDKARLPSSPRPCSDPPARAGRHGVVPGRDGGRPAEGLLPRQVRSHAPQAPARAPGRACSLSLSLSLCRVSRARAAAGGQAEAQDAARVHGRVRGQQAPHQRHGAPAPSPPRPRPRLSLIVAGALVRAVRRPRLLAPVVAHEHRPAGVAVQAGERGEGQEGRAGHEAQVGPHRRGPRRLPLGGVLHAALPQGLRPQQEDKRASWRWRPSAGTR